MALGRVARRWPLPRARAHGLAEERREDGARRGDPDSGGDLAGLRDSAHQRASCRSSPYAAID